ncbi:MAG: NADH-quinone oxidoreductase subunit C [Actinomycetota bacterium]|nr:NADH-quinone oxidoreductase subunit C [Actinomycetota bacterium]
MIEVVLRDEKGSYFPSREQYFELITELKESSFEFLSDLCAVDYLGNESHTLPDGVVPERFEVVVNLISLQDRERVRIRVQVPENDCTIRSIYDIYQGAEAMEREAYDLFGIVFEEHPDLTRILMPEGWEGHPLRKDYSVGRVPVQFKSSTSIR